MTYCTIVYHKILQHGSRCAPSAAPSSCTRARTRRCRTRTSTTTTTTSTTTTTTTSTAVTTTTTAAATTTTTTTTAAAAAAAAAAATTTTTTKVYGFVLCEVLVAVTVLYVLLDVVAIVSCRYQDLKVLNCLCCCITCC